MLRKEENDQLTQVGPGTPMGELLRRYWYPVAASAELTEHPVKLVKILGESLVLYRDSKGRPGLIGDTCPHRRVSLIYGIPEQEGLRCAYHGWMFNREGRCIEQPAESPESTFKDRVAIAGYPVEELGGVIFAYLGAKPVPLLPRWDLFVRENALRDIGVAEIPCNWIQIMENSLDPVHVEWLHRHFYNYVRERLDRDDRCIPVRHEKIGFTVFEYGIVKRRVLEGDTEQSENWQVGHSVIFPNVLRSGSARTPVFQIRVPVDDTHTMHWWYNCYGVEPGAEAPTQEKIPLFKVSVPGVDEYGQPEWARLDNNSGQDLAMWHSQGPIADRSLEKLGESDEGIILYRKLLKDQIEKVRRGEEPMNVFRDPAKNICIRLSAEQDKAGRSVRKTRQGGATKYSPILDALEQQGTDVKDILVGSAVD